MGGKAFHFGANCDLGEMATSIRAPSWTHEEILALIGVWSDHSVQQMLDGATRTADIWKLVSDRLAENRISRSPKQCKEKIKNLRQLYKDFKDGRNRSGRERDTWPYFDLLDAVLGIRPATRPTIVIDTTRQTPTPPDEDGSGEEEESAEVESDMGHIHHTREVNDLTAADEEVEQDSPDISATSSTTGSEATPTTTGQRRGASDREVAAPSSKRSKRTGIERALQSLTDSFLTHQQEMEKRMLESEERRLRLEREQAERMHRDNQEHEMRLLRILGQIIAGSHQTAQPQLQPPHVPYPCHPAPYYGMPPTTGTMPYPQPTNRSMPLDEDSQEQN